MNGRSGPDKAAPENTATKQSFTDHRTARPVTAARYNCWSITRLWLRTVRLERRVEALERRVDELTRTCRHGAQ